MLAAFRPVFSWNYNTCNMETIRIINSLEHVTENFTMAEFWKPKYGGGIDFDIPVCLVKAAQILRDSFKCPVLITSTIRPSDTFGYHVNGHAVDFVPQGHPVEQIAEFEHECRAYIAGEGSAMIEALRAAGVNGFGLEASNCIHLDSRPEKNCTRKDKYGKYIVFSWNKQTGSQVL